MVMVAGSPGSPDVLRRRRIEIADRAIPGSKQPFHHAKELGIEKAQAYLDECAESSGGLARHALETAIADLRDFKVGACSILMSSGRPASSLEAILASHAAIHTAEGDFFREAVARAAKSFRLRCEKIKEKELLASAKAAFGMADLEERVNAMGKSTGPPWRQDEKYAALAGWLALRS